MKTKFDHSYRRLSIIVPLYNEQEAVQQLHDRLTPVIRRLRSAWNVQLILVDDGSSDHTWPLLKSLFGDFHEAEVNMPRHAVNGGIGAAMRTGFEAATGDIVCSIDCDCTYAPEELPGMLDMLISSRADIVTASPYHPLIMQENPSYRFFLSQMCSRLYSLIIPKKLFCYTSFFRAYRRHWARTDLFNSNDFLGVTEILISAAYCGANIVEYPVSLKLRTLGRSKMRTLKVMRDHLRLLWKSIRLNCKMVFSQLIFNWGPKLNGDEIPAVYTLDPVAEGYETILDQMVLVGRIAEDAGRPAIVYAPQSRLPFLAKHSPGTSADVAILSNF